MLDKEFIADMGEVVKWTLKKQIDFADFNFLLIFFVPEENRIVIRSVSDLFDKILLQRLQFSAERMKADHHSLPCDTIH